MKNTPNSNRLHIGIFGKTNSGKSSLLNAITEQDISIVSDIAGTTTDSVTKAMEFLPYGPVLFIDTAGLEDESELGEVRMKKTIQELKRTDFALLVMDVNAIDMAFYKDQEIIFKKYNIPFLLVLNKCENLTDASKYVIKKIFPNGIFISTKNRESILHLKEHILKEIQKEQEEPKLISDIIPYNGKIIMVVPIDSEAPKGRLILPQVQLLRECLDSGIKSYVVRDTELKSALEDISDIDLVITDSQAFKNVEKIVENKAKLTSFSIIFARQKGDLKDLVVGVKKLSKLNHGDKILISETCTHNTSHEDIGRVKIPKLIRNYCGKELEFEFKSGKDFPEDLSKYAMIIHCGGCMINRKLMQSRIDEAKALRIPITNYGLVIAEVNGILDKAIQIFR
ncbi:[FeFe] hydrogenase H-cluster maturation GTPase HydF [Cetobacterium sp. 8H]|uniref:[FeFe] hydrogenase H-cluster maturation GTPase HydF n=1 Tax=Cetobacterium sp. 8H TaxID=2759681 RepID=UPI00163BCC17|nr:[FeFe] hydrogenase H-cluster maturation GTPase HydF [Cetobacterium sp. 8H]MBC2850443.1 [FeFe] hydrogenase H-cluster maturation GTPase HydF [Cetobacterium sp. 8H]